MKTLYNLLNAAFALVLLFAIVQAFRGDRSPIFVYLALFHLLTNALRALGRSLRARRRATEHARAESSAANAPLTGGDCVLYGKVAYARDAREAMRMDFVQAGSESESSGSWSHKWKEIDRKLTVQPFYVVRPDGSRVRVEPPPEQSRLFDELESKILVRSQIDTKVVTEGPLRGRFATLVPDETIWLTGRLVRGVDPEAGATDRSTAYRQSGRPESWVLTGAPTLLVSSVSLAEHFAGRARRHFRDAVLYAVLLIAPLAMVHRYVDRLQGKTEAMTVESVRELTDDSDRVTGYVAMVRHDDHLVETDSFDEAPKVGSEIAMRVGRHSINTGPVARYSVDEMALSFVILMACIVLRCVLYHLSTSALPWYRSEKIRVDEGGPGRLPQPT